MGVVIDILSWRHSFVKTFFREDIRSWRHSFVKTFVREDIRSWRHSFVKTFFREDILSWFPMVSILVFRSACFSKLATPGNLQSCVKFESFLTRISHPEFIVVEGVVPQNDTRNYLFREMHKYREIHIERYIYIERTVAARALTHKTQILVCKHKYVYGEILVYRKIHTAPQRKTFCVAFWNTAMDKVRYTRIERYTWWSDKHIERDVIYTNLLHLECHFFSLKSKSMI